MGKYDALRHEVFLTNKEIAESGLALLTWGNASGVDRKLGVFAIKPSGVSFRLLKEEDMVIIDLESGDTIEGLGRPSSDSEIHRVLYRGFEPIGGIVHTHSLYATSWSQAGREIPVYGTTHADYWGGPVPICRTLTKDEVEGTYETNTGTVIVEHFVKNRLLPENLPGILVPSQGPFTWGRTAAKALETSMALEALARMASITEALNPSRTPMGDALLHRHFARKYGPDAYYGQRPMPD